MKKIVKMLLVFSFLPTIALAAGSDVDPGWNHIIWSLVTTLLGIVSTVAVAVVTALVYKYLGIKIDGNQQDQLRGYADQAIDFAEQKAKNSSINKDNRSQVALNYLLEMIDKSKIPNIAAERAVKLIEARLGADNKWNALDSKSITTVMSTPTTTNTEDIKSAVDVK